MDYLSGPKMVTRVLLRGRQEGQNQKKEMSSQREVRDGTGRGRLEDGEATHQGMQVALGLWKRQGKRFFKPLKGM